MLTAVIIQCSVMLETKFLSIPLLVKLARVLLRGPEASRLPNIDKMPVPCITIPLGSMSLRIRL
jgi:hypothetical protein